MDVQKLDTLSHPRSVRGRLLRPFQSPALKRFMRSGYGPVGLVMLIILIVLATLAPMLAPRDPFSIDGPRLTAPNADYVMGTDNLGRDIFSDVLNGARVSLLIGVIAAGISAVLGIIVGSISGYYGGWIDILLSRMTEVFLITPSFFLIIVVVATLGSNILYIMIVIGLTTWATNARLMRVSALALRQRTFVQAALVLGEPRYRILIRHVIPNGLAPVIANSTLLVANAILIEAGLSFLGLGDPNTTSWGQMVYVGQSYVRNAPWISIFPGIAIVITVMSFYLIGDGISAMLNPRRQLLDE
ncbi:MAG TPA: ABC transporter permease [Phototrophicaceae bacterium]|nr:ABC transporter permease [Phototrophicaceae bacterium]